jgi:hypothetical protein
LSGKDSLLSRKNAGLLAVGVVAVTALLAVPSPGYGQVIIPQGPDLPPLILPEPPSPPLPLPPPVEVPTHLRLGDQTFEATVPGLRMYLDAIRSTDAALYTQLAPDLERLESRLTIARTTLIAGVGLGLASLLYGLATRNDCTAPSAFGPNLAARSAAWGACNDDGMQTMSTFALFGLGAMIVGGSVAWAEAPQRSDVLAFINKHNRLSREPLHLEIGYDPRTRLALAGGALTF